MNIKQTRKQLGITQEEMAKKLGISRPTYIQIETGKKEPTISQARVIAELLHPEEKKKITKNPAKTSAKKVLRFNAEKFKEVLLYVLEKVGAKPNIGETALYKILYFIDFDYFEKHGKYLTGATYMKNHYGPTPKQFKPITDEMIAGGELERVNSKYFQYEQKKYLPHRKADLERFNGIEIEHIDDVLARLSDKNGSELRTYSHDDIPWIATEDQKDIDYKLVFQRISPYSQINEDQLWLDASAADILKELGEMSNAEYDYYQNLPDKK